MNKQLKRFLCFFLCFCLCFAWFGPSIETKALVLESWMIYAIITYMAAMGVTFIAAGGVDAMVNAMEDKVNQYDTIVIDFYDVLRKNIKLVPPPDPPEGSSELDLFFTAAGVEAMRGFLNWITTEGGWDKGTAVNSELTDYFVNSSIAQFEVNGSPKLISLVENSAKNGPLAARVGTKSISNYGDIGTIIPYPSGVLSVTYMEFPEFSYGNTEFLYTIEDGSILFKGSQGGAGSVCNISNILNTYGLTIEQFVGMVFHIDYGSNSSVDSRRLVASPIFSNGTIYRVSPIVFISCEGTDYSEFYDYNNSISTITIPQEIPSVEPSPSEGVLLDTGVTGADTIEAFGDAVENLFIDTGTIPQPVPQIVADPEYNVDPTPIPTPDVESDGTLEGSVSGILEWIKAIFEAILSLPQAIANLLLDGIKSIFIPDPDEMNDQFMVLLEEINEKYMFDFDLASLFSSSKEPEDITAVYSVGTLSWDLTFVSWYYLKKGVEFFRPFIRGFIVLMLIFYNLRQFMAIFGLGGVMNGDSADRRVADLTV